MNNSVDYLIIGGGIAGVTAAEEIREIDNKSQIAIISSEPHLLYSRVLLPSYLKQRIKREQVFMRKVTDFDSLNIHLYTGEEAVEVRPSAHDVVLRSGITINYKKLLIASGGKVRPVPFDGASYVHEIYRLQTIDDADLLYKALPTIKEAIVVGSGFIALEFLEILHLRGIKTTLLCADTQFAKNFISPEGSLVVANNFNDRGITALFGESVASVIGLEKKIQGVITSAGSNIKCDALFVGIGIQRVLEFLEGSGIVTGTDSILTDAYLKTNLDDIFAAGDVTEFDDVLLGVRHKIGTWNNAFLQGKAAGKNMAGKNSPFKNLSTYAISNLGLHLTFIGHVNFAERSIIRHAENSNQYVELFQLNGVLVGAALINAPKLQSLIQRWILERRNITGREAELLDIQKPLESFT